MANDLAGELKEIARHASSYTYGALAGELSKAAAEIERLSAQVAAAEAERQRWLDCARVDATMEGPVRIGWNHSALNRLYDAAIRAHGTPSEADIGTGGWAGASSNTGVRYDAPSEAEK